VSPNGGKIGQLTTLPVRPAPRRGANEVSSPVECGGVDGENSEATPTPEEGSLCSGSSGDDSRCSESRDVSLCSEKLESKPLCCGDRGEERADAAA
jgi:hypothetical protein